MLARVRWKKKKKAVQQANKEVQGGGLTNVWDTLHAQGVVISLEVVAPPAKNPYEVEQN